MARPIVVRGVTFTFDGRIAWDAIDAILAAANRGDTTANRQLEAISAGVHAFYGAWPTAANQLGKFVHAGVCSLRRCPECTHWFLAFKKTQHTCRRVECRSAYKRADARRRAARSRQIEIERQQRALARVTKTGT